MDTVNNFCNAACLKFKMPRSKTGYLRTIHFFQGSNKMQESAKEVHNHLTVCDNFAGFLVKIFRPSYSNVF